MKDIFVEVNEKNKPLAEFISSIYEMKEHCKNTTKEEKYKCENCSFRWNFSICSHGCLYVNSINELLPDIESVMLYNDLTFKEGIDLDFQQEED